MGSTVKIMAPLTLKCLFFLLAATLGLAKACTDGILLVGGKTPYGPQQEIKLLRDSGWCESSGFPFLPEPVDNPAVFYRNGVLVVCGFTTESPCKYTSRGWESWSEVHSDFPDEGYKMAYSSKVGSVMLVSKTPQTTTQNHIQHNPMLINPMTNSLIPWMEISGSPFSVSCPQCGSYPFLYYLDITNSCLGSYNADLVLSGGYSSRYCTRCSSASSKSHVAFWSVEGNADNTGGPEFEQNVIPEMMTSREGHGCIEFEGMFIAVGGYDHRYDNTPYGGVFDNYHYHNSSEFYDGTAWKEGENLNSPRAHFALQKMCGSLVSIGGVTGDGQYSDTVERLWTVWNSWIPADYLTLPKPLAYTGSAAVSGLDCWQETA